MHRHRASAALAIAAFPIFSQNLVRLPELPAQRDSALADSLKTAAPSDSAQAADDTVSYSALRIRYRNDHFSLADKALLQYQGSALIADSIVYYPHDDLVEAVGAPLITDKSNPPILGYRMRYNVKRKVGTVYYGMSKRDHQNFNGVEVRRQSDGDVYIARGDFSTCDLVLDKHYYFYARRMIVEPTSKVLSGPIVMNIGDVPVAVLPMMVMPLGKGRRSGLLQPKFGGDQSQGFYLQNLGYYWAISDYMDFLTSADVIEGARGTFDNTNLNATYKWNKRYVWSGLLSGKAYVSEFDPSRAGGVLDFSNDLNLTPDGRQTLKGSGRLQSDPTIVDRNSITETDRLQQTANATLGYRRQFDWNQAVLNADLTQSNNLTQNQVDRSVPNLTFHVGGPLFPASEDEPTAGEIPWFRKWSWDYGNHFNVNQVSRPAFATLRGDTSTYVGYSDRLSFTGKYSALRYFNLTPSLNLSQLWSLDSRTGDTTRPHRVAWEPARQEYGDYFFAWNTGVSADTRLYGIAQADGAPWFGYLAAVRHTLTPGVSFTYAPKLDSNTHLYPNPKIGGAAFQNEQKAVGMQLANDVDLKIAQPDSGKKKPVTYKLLSSNSQLSYNFANPLRPWSDLGSTVSLYLTRNVAFTLSATHALYDDYADPSQLNAVQSPILKTWGFGWRKGIELGGGFSTGLRMRDSHGLPMERFEQSPWSASLNYGFDFNAQRVGSRGGSAGERFFGSSEFYQITRTHQASGSLRLNPTAGWKMSYDTEFNFSEGRFARHSFGFDRTLHCWSMEFHWTPVGVSEGWNFLIHIIDLPDIKLQTSDTHFPTSR